MTTNSTVEAVQKIVSEKGINANEKVVEQIAKLSDLKKADLGDIMTIEACIFLVLDELKIYDFKQEAKPLNQLIPPYNISDIFTKEHKPTLEGSYNSYIATIDRIYPFSVFQRKDSSEKGVVTNFSVNDKINPKFFCRITVWDKIVDFDNPKFANDESVKKLKIGSTVILKKFILKYNTYQERTRPELHNGYNWEILEVKEK